MPERSFKQYIKSNFNDVFTTVDGFVSDNNNELDLETLLVEYIDEDELSGIEIMQVYANDSESMESNLMFW